MATNSPCPTERLAFSTAVIDPRIAEAETATVASSSATAVGEATKLGPT